jgi:hypothetical protein
MNSARSPSDRRRALEPKNRKLSLRRQCELLGLNRRTDHLIFVTPRSKEWGVPQKIPELEVQPCK